MIVLYIVLGLIALAVAILLTNISLIFSYNEKIDFKLKILFLSVNADKIIELTEASDKNKSDKNKQVELQEHKKAALKKKKSPTDVIDAVDYVIELISAVLGEFIKYARIKVARIKISIGGDDCAETALLYGVVSSALYSLLEFFDSFLLVKKSYKNIGVFPDFASDRCKVNMKIVLRLKIMHLLLILIGILPTLAKAKKGK